MITRAIIHNAQRALGQAIPHPAYKTLEPPWWNVPPNLKVEFFDWVYKNYPDAIRLEPLENNYYVFGWRVVILEPRNTIRFCVPTVEGRKDVDVYVE